MSRPRLWDESMHIQVVWCGRIPQATKTQRRPKCWAWFLRTVNPQERVRMQKAEGEGTLVGRRLIYLGELKWWGPRWYLLSWARGQVSLSCATLHVQAASLWKWDPIILSNPANEEPSLLQYFALAATDPFLWSSSPRIRECEPLEPSSHAVLTVFL